MDIVNILNIYPFVLKCSKQNCWQNLWLQNFKVYSSCRKHFPFLFSFMTYHRVCNYINTRVATRGARTAYPSGAHELTPVFSGVRVTLSLVLCVCFVDRCLSFLSFFFWPLCCLFFFDIRILITTLVSSSSSYMSRHNSRIFMFVCTTILY